MFGLIHMLELTVAPAKAGAQGKRMKSLGSRFRGNDELNLVPAQTPQFPDSLFRGNDDIC